MEDSESDPDSETWQNTGLANREGWSEAVRGQARAPKHL